MASDEKVVEKEEKGKGQNEEVTTESTSSAPIATPVYEWEKDPNGVITTQASSSVPPATTPLPVHEQEKDQPVEVTTEASSSTPAAAAAPPVPEKDEGTAQPSPLPRPLPQVPAPYQPPLLSNTNERGSRRPEIFPVSNYIPPDVHSHVPEKVPVSKGWHMAKLFLSTISLVLSTVVIGLGLGIFNWGGRSSNQEVLFGVTGCTAGLAIFWTAVDNVVTCLSRGRHRIAPGAHVALHLIIWLMAAASVTILGILAQDNYYYRARYYYYDIVRLESAILGLMIVILIFHFILFIRACIETQEVNLITARNKGTIVRYIQVPVPVDASGRPLFPDAPPGMAYPQMAVINQTGPPGPSPYWYGQPQGNVPPQVLLGGYYAPAGPPVDPSAQLQQPSPATLLHGYYGRPPAPSSGYARRSSHSGARRQSQASGSGSRRARQPNQAPPSETPKYV